MIQRNRQNGNGNELKHQKKGSSSYRALKRHNVFGLSKLYVKETQHKCR